MEQKKQTLLKWDAPVPVDDPDQAHKMRKAVATAGAGVDSMNREVINSIFPPVEFTEDGVKYTQSVSINAVTKTDVKKLKLQLDNMLLNRKARNTGVCLIRSDLYSQCFDEIVRQVTVDCNPRGRLLLRVREHYRMMLNSYKELYELSLDWGKRKELQIGQGVPDLKTYHDELVSRKRTLELQANELQIKLDALEKRLAESKQLREKDHADEIAFLKRQGQMCKAQIDMLNSQK
ncbi:Inner dynein arm light chain, axonemal-related protein [Tritrichomonas foetus]|uniref:Inner dynein arm light chain, axonemal-related protein n=1 Tax=Tritrichomonas foetus TaxID=1144522 RepID=A0A1J4JBT3_9EUKA|nr:Inner dynein arm light chain, axonemal-related protein [Tritrichomonas foetus]|eukprot:OHS95115.1 Inner dynein arm light chain, axonemal-related protein [Tritrichomonas foetus]